MASITFSGLATGLDTTALIESLLQVERVPIQRLEDQKAALSSQSSKLGSLRTRLKSLESAMEDLTDREDLLAARVSTSDETVARATVSGEPTLGGIDLEVTALAQATRIYSDGVAAPDQAGLLGAGTITIQVGADAPVDVVVDAADTLETLAGKIDDSGAGVSAAVIFDGTSYRLRVAGDETGAARAVAITEAGTTLGLGDPANEAVAASDAVFTVDGLAMTRSSNTVADAIPGVSLDLVGTGASTRVTVERDPDAVREKVQAFVDAYNQVQSFINVEFAFIGVAKGPESLSGDATLRTLQGRLRSVVGNAPAGLTGEVRTLADLGVEGSRDGSLALDGAALEGALATDPDGVMAVLNGDASASVTGLFEDLARVVADYADTGGILESRVDALEGRSRDIDGQIDRLERRIDQTEENLRRRYALLEQTVSGLQNQGNQLLAVLGGL
ncbi:MAG: flagellar filament capping protein FliD [Sandaracinaceae bacterium]